MSAPYPAPRTLTGRFVLLTLLSFFGVVFAVNFVMMKLAIDTLPGTEVDSAYSASLGFGKEIAAARDQDARNWRVDAHIQRGAEGDATLKVEAHDSRGAPISGLRFQGRLERPTDRRADRPLVRRPRLAGPSRARPAGPPPAVERGPDRIRPQLPLVCHIGHGASRQAASPGGAGVL